MPQMAPMNWMLLFITTIGTILIMSSILFFHFKPKFSSYVNFTQLNTQFTMKW
uniref:ATP synthase F0 subunit 8 n=1 Tax=Paraschizogynium plumachela TaxID=3109024 RepID=UPI002E76150F|nr:ATP synthase F0 subunit 8 [Paraschizogynium plumachela]WQM21753.1 ATP synthase F0 subunit 8 [Paraschizogynium plumachela]